MFQSFLAPNSTKIEVAVAKNPKAINNPYIEYGKSLINKIDITIIKIVNQILARIFIFYPQY